MILVEAQRPLAESIGRRYGRSEPTVDDALMKLYERVRTFDLAAGHRFSTWATWWLRIDMGIIPGTQEPQ